MLKTEHLFHYQDEFVLESGKKLLGFQLKYTTLGQLNKEHNNVVWVCHALTGNSDFTTWWDGLFRKDGPFDPRHYFIICANTLGGCYGSTGPLSINPSTGKAYLHDFPMITNRDVVAGFDLLREDLGIREVHTLIGGSLGGQQALEWAIQKPDVFINLIPVACNAYHSPWGIAFNEAQRMAIEADASWKENDSRAGQEGLKAARAMGMISFRSFDAFAETQSEKSSEKLDDFRASAYQRYQGLKLANRFNAFTYWSLTKAMDSHHVGRGREGAEKALNAIKAKTLVVGMKSDILFPLIEQQYLAEFIPNSEFEIVSTPYGHDGFLIEFEQLKTTIKKFFKQQVTEKEISL